jgi:hypothetical protein
VQIDSNDAECRRWGRSNVVPDHLGRHFLYGPPDASGNDTYVLCEINVSSVFAIPGEAPGEIARAMASRLRRSAV